MNKWDVRFLQMATFVASWSKDPSTQVGCVLANDKHQIVSLGYNGFPRGAKDNERLNVREQKYKMVIHAEENAILNATGPIEGATAYLTHPPCLHCTGMLKQVGVRRVVFEEPDTRFASRWNLEEVKLYLDELDMKYSAFRRT